MLLSVHVDPDMLRFPDGIEKWGWQILESSQRSVPDSWGGADGGTDSVE